ncbi:coiled-coil domain-containing protein 97 [Aricia agestis]|uniref:coiled-coil domain-containing protein 97 n=1 Tax=Aricia agestis TaxID=91739 RepID=UPI001C20A6E3|nr:coiled-coil domain-containing protein 97 [Aricia agestis]
MTSDCNNMSDCDDGQSEIDPIHDIIDYLVRCVNISFLHSHVNEQKANTKENISAAIKLYEQSPTQFLTQFGKYCSPNHISYFENLPHLKHNAHFQECINHLKLYHSKEQTIKRIRNRRFKALQRLKSSTDYFSDKQMMYRNPLLYEQLVGQYLTNEELQERDGMDTENDSFLKVILESVERNEMREKRNIQSMLEDLHLPDSEDHITEKVAPSSSMKEKRWGDFDEPDTQPSHIPEPRLESMINANERNLLREEFLQEMYSSFIEGHDMEFDYSTVDNNEEYDDLEQISRDAEDRYFDSEDNDSNNLEEHMKLINEYGRKQSSDSSAVDPLDEFMTHIENKLNQ